jgi:hypothetical protein
MVSGTEVNCLRYTIKTTRNKSDGESRQTVVFLGKTTRSSYYYKSRKCRRMKKFKNTKSFQERGSMHYEAGKSGIVGDSLKEGSFSSGNVACASLSHTPSS